MWHWSALEKKKRTDVAPTTTRPGFNQKRPVLEPTSPAVEVWFPGCHSDVGGGYKEPELSYAPLNWMVRMADNLGLLVDKAKIPEEPFFAETMPVAHDETKSIGWKAVNVLTGDWFFNRSIAVADVVYPTVTQLRGLGYSPDYLPQYCVVWNESDAMKNLA